jgi:hypothetical protein
MGQTLTRDLDIGEQQESMQSGLGIPCWVLGVRVPTPPPFAPASAGAEDHLTRTVDLDADLPDGEDSGERLINSCVINSGKLNIFIGTSQPNQCLSPGHRIPSWASAARLPTPPPFVFPSSDAEVDMANDLDVQQGINSGES